MAHDWMRYVWMSVACASLLLAACDEEPGEHPDGDDMAADAARPDADAGGGAAGTKAPPRGVRTTTHYCLSTREAVRRAEASGADPSLDMDAGEADTGPHVCPETQPATVFCSRVALMSVDQDLCCYVETSSTEC